MKLDVEIIRWTFTDSQLEITVRVPGVAAQETFVKRRDFQGRWAWHTNDRHFSRTPDVSIRSNLDTLVAQHRVLGVVARYVGIYMPEPGAAS